jgi:molybdenum cofactor biosynthesis enzyme MoaA
MTYEEMLQACTLLVKMGIEKIRITGGEPFVRKDIMQLLTALSKLDGLKELKSHHKRCFNGPARSRTEAIGVRSVNLSLDTLDANRFFAITRRDEFASVMETMQQLLKHDIEVKINTVVMAGKNTQDIIPLVQLTKELPVSVRFIEEMPFNGDGHSYSGIVWDYVRIFDEIRQSFPDIQKVPDPQFSTSYNYSIPGHKGSVGIIAAYSRTFCGTCNRIRITPQGTLKNCLYDDGVLNIKDLMRLGMDDVKLEETLRAAFNVREKDGWEAERKRLDDPNFHESMATIGG